MSDRISRCPSLPEAHLGYPSGRRTAQSHHRVRAAGGQNSARSLTESSDEMSLSSKLTSACSRRTVLKRLKITNARRERYRGTVRTSPRHRSLASQYMRESQRKGPWTGVPRHHWKKREVMLPKHSLLEFTLRVLIPTIICNAEIIIEQIFYQCIETVIEELSGPLRFRM